MGTARERIAGFVGFQWDDGSADQNSSRRQVSRSECEEVFFAGPLVAAPHTAHSQEEARYHVLGHTARGRHLFIACCIREQRIRVISARPMSRRERRVYDQATT